MPEASYVQTGFVDPKTNVITEGNTFVAASKEVISTPGCKSSGNSLLTSRLFYSQFLNAQADL